MAEANDVAFIPEQTTARQEACRTVPPRSMPLFSARLWSNSLGNVVFILFASWLFPAKTAHRTLKLSLPKCWLLHLGTGLFGALFIAGAFIAINESPVEVLYAVDDALIEWGRQPITVSFFLLGIAVWIELSQLALAFLVFAWGGVADERLRDSYRHALKQVWMRTPHAVLISLLICVLALTLDKAGDRWRASHPEPSIWPTYPMPPTLPATDPNYAAAQKQYKQEMRGYRTKSVKAELLWKEWKMAQPWPLRREEPFSIAVGCLATVWWLTALLRALGIRRSVRSEQRSPLCLWCGYNLSTMPMESRCPECGQAVANSLGEAAQPGAAWVRRRRAGRVSAWWHSWRGGVRDAVAFGRSLRLSESGRDHHAYMLLHLPIIFIMGALGIAVCAGQTEGLSDLTSDWPFTFLMVGLVGSACVLGTVLVTCGSASLAGWLLSLRAGRNLLPASMQMAAYGATYLVVWAFFGAVIINGAVHLQMTGMYRIAQEFTGIHSDAIQFFSCFLPNLACGLIYLWLLARGTNGARYANR